MKKVIPYLVYFALSIASTYVFQTILFMWISLSRFTAADGPPGDIGLFEKLFYSIGWPIFYFFVLTISLIAYCSLLKKYRIEVRRSVPIIVNSLVSLYVMI